MSAYREERAEIIEAVLKWCQERLINCKDIDTSLALPEAMHVELLTRPSKMIPPGEVRASWHQCQVASFDGAA